MFRPAGALGPGRDAVRFPRGLAGRAEIPSSAAACWWTATAGHFSR